MSNIIEDFFIKPMIDPMITGYNPINTLTFIILLVIACTIIYFILKKRIKFDYNFFISLIPYILFGISMRVIMHRIEAGLLIIDGITKTANPLEFGFWFFTPGVWILTFITVTIGLLLAGVHKKFNTKIFLGFGLIACTIPVLYNFIGFNNWNWFLFSFGLIISASLLLIWLINRFTKYKILQDKLNIFIVLGQGFDGIASAIAIQYFNFSEQHVLSAMIMDYSPFLFAAIKLLIAVLICWSLDDYAKENKERRNLVGFIKIIVAILGFATGLASLFKLGII